MLSDRSLTQIYIVESIDMKFYTKPNYDRKQRHQGAKWGGRGRLLTSKEQGLWGGGDGSVLYHDWVLVNYMTVCLCQTSSNCNF